MKKNKTKKKGKNLQKELQQIVQRETKDNYGFPYLLLNISNGVRAEFRTTQSGYM